MSLLVGELHGLLRLDDRQFNQGIDNAERKMKSAEGGFSGFKGAGMSAMSGIATATAGLVVAIGAAVTAVVAGIGKIGLETNATMEQSNIAWETLLGTADRAKQMTADLQTLGAKTPFEFEGLDKSAKLLKAMGVESNNIIPYLTKVGDAVSAVGGNQETLQGVSMALGQMLTKGKVSAEEMNQMAERGIPVWQMMADKLGMSKQQLMDLSSQGKVLAEDAVPALVSAMGEKFGGAMEKQSATFNGLMSTMKDNVKMFAAELTAPTFEKFKEWLPIINDLVTQLAANFKTGGWEGVFVNMLPESVYIPLIDMIDGIKGAIETMKQVYVDNKDQIESALNSMKETFSAVFAAIFEVLKFVIDVIQVIWAEWGDNILGIWSGLWAVVAAVIKAASGIIIGIVQWLRAMFSGDMQGIEDAGKKIWSSLWDGIVGILKGAGQIILNVLDMLFPGFKAWFLDLADKAIEWGKNIITGLIDGIKAEWDALVAMVGKVVNFVKGIFTGKDGFDTHSPSKFTHEVGKNVSIGLGDGIASMKDYAVGKAQEVSDAVKGSLQDTQRLIAEFGKGGSSAGASEDQINTARWGSIVAGSGNNANLDLIANDQGRAGLDAYFQDEFNRLKAANPTGIDAGVLKDMAKANVDSLLMGKGSQYSGSQMQASGQSTTNHFDVQIRASDLKEVNNVVQLVGKLQTAARTR